MTNSAFKTIVSSSKSDNYSSSINPLKNRPFFAIPRQIALYEGMSDRLFRLLAVLFSAYGSDGHIEFKISTLARLMQKGIRQTKELIQLARNDGWIETKQTGHSLVFFLTEKCYGNQVQEVRKPAPRRCGKPHISYKEQKEREKETTTPPAATKSPPVKPQNPDLKNPSVVALISLMSVLYASDIDIGFIVEMMAIYNLSIGKVKDVINRMNDIKGIKNARGLFRKLCRSSDLIDLDLKVEQDREIARQKLKAEIEITNGSKEMSEKIIDEDWGNGVKMMREMINSKARLFQ